MPSITLHNVIQGITLCNVMPSITLYNVMPSIITYNVMARGGGLSDLFFKVYNPPPPPPPLPHPPHPPNLRNPVLSSEDHSHFRRPWSSAPRFH